MRAALDSVEKVAPFERVIEKMRNLFAEQITSPDGDSMELRRGKFARSNSQPPGD
jgi:hypothetical protein